MWAMWARGRFGPGRPLFFPPAPLSSGAAGTANGSPLVRIWPRLPTRVQKVVFGQLAAKRALPSAAVKGKKLSKLQLGLELSAWVEVMMSPLLSTTTHWESEGQALPVI